MAKKKTTKKKVTKKPEPAVEADADEAPPEQAKAADVNVFEELVNALDGHKPQSAKETEQAYLARLAREVTEMDDAAWDNLPRPAQEWVEGAAAALEGQTEIEACPGRPVKAAEEKAGKTTKKKTTKKAGAGGLPKARRAAGEAATSPTGRAQQLLCINPEMADADIQKILDKEGLVISPSTFQMNLSQVKRVMRFLAEAGHLKPAIAELYA